MSDLDKLEALAKAATPAWTCTVGVYEDPDGDNDYIFCRGPMIGRQGGAVGAVRSQGVKDVKFIEAASPATVLDLVAEVRRLRAALDATTQATSCHSCVRGDGTDIIAELTAKRDALRKDRDCYAMSWAEEFQRREAAEAHRDAIRARLAAIDASTDALAVAIRELKERRNNWAASLAQLQARGGDEGGDFVTTSYERTIAEVDGAIAAVKRIKEGV